MLPLMMTIMNLAMFGVALPTIRDTFRIQADVAAWIVTASGVIIAWHLQE
jgi:hypothetical protein